MEIMADALISANADIIRCNNKHFEKIRKRRVISRLRKTLYNTLCKEGDGIYAHDIINFCLLVDTAKRLEFTSNNIDGYSIQCRKNKGSTRWPVVGMMSIDIDTKGVGTLKHINYEAGMETPVDTDGDMLISWEVDNTTNRFGRDTTSVIRLERKIKKLDLDTIYKETNNDMYTLLKTAYLIYYEIVSFYIENIIIGMRKECLK